VNETIQLYDGYVILLTQPSIPPG